MRPMRALLPKLGPALAAAMLVACGGRCGDAARRDAGTSTTPEAPRAGRVGTVVGTVVLAPATTLPRWTLAQIGRDPTQPPLPPECSPPKDEDTLPVRAGEGGLLDGIIISATGDRDAFAARLPPHAVKDVTVAIEDCRLTPHVVVAGVGDTLVIENRTDEPFLPTAGPAPVLETLLFRQSRRVPLEHGGLTAIECRFAHGCGRADLLVLPNHVATVSREGRFELEVPADMPLQIHAWHPLFLESQVQTTVRQGGRVEVRIVVRPAPPRTPRPPRPEPTPNPNAPLIE